jgi:hypothetical protein
MGWPRGIWVDDPTDAAAPRPAPKATAFLLAAFADMYRQEVVAEEDVHRTLPFFGTALGVVIAAIVYVASRLPPLPGVATRRQTWVFWLALTLLALATLDAAGVLWRISRAAALRQYERIGPEPALYSRFLELQAFHARETGSDAAADDALIIDMQQGLLESYTIVTPGNRVLTRRAYRHRALAFSHLMRSLMWALGATIIIFVADKLGYLPGR